MDDIVIKKLLKDSFLFNKVDDDTLETLTKEGSIVEVLKNRSFDQSDTLKYTYIIIKGYLKITKIDPNTGRSITLFVFENGDIYDFITILDAKEHIVFPIALEDVTMLKLPIDTIRNLINSCNELNSRFLPYLGKHMRHLEEFGESLVFDDTITRLSKLILKHILPKQNEKEPHHHIKIINKLSHESIAEMVGSVRSVITVQLQKLKKENIILRKEGHLIINDLEKLIKKCDTNLTHLKDKL